LTEKVTNRSLIVLLYSMKIFHYQSVHSSFQHSRHCRHETDLQ